MATSSIQFQVTDHQRIDRPSQPQPPQRTLVLDLCRRTQQTVVSSLSCCTGSEDEVDWDNFYELQPSHTVLQIFLEQRRIEGQNRPKNRNSNAASYDLRLSGVGTPWQIVISCLRLRKPISLSAEAKSVAHVPSETASWLDFSLKVLEGTPKLASTHASSHRS